MRDPSRIDGFLRALESVWKQHPDQRFGQLIMNLSRDQDGFADTWEWEEDDWLARMQNYLRGEPTQDPGQRATELLTYGVRQAEDGPYIAVPSTSLSEAVANDVLALGATLASLTRRLEEAEKEAEWWKSHLRDAIYALRNQDDLTREDIAGSLDRSVREGFPGRSR